VILHRKAGLKGRRFYFHAGLFVLSCTSGFLAAGKTGAIGGAIAIGLMLLIGGHLRIWIGVLATAVIGYVVFDLALRQLEVGLFAHWQQYNFERLGTLQSRLELWIGAIEGWSESVRNAILGRGFTSFRASPLPSLGGWTPGHAHNSFITLLVDMGIVGTFFFVMMLARPIGRSALTAIRQRGQFSESPAFPPFIALTSLMIGSLMDDVFGGTLQPTTYLLIGTVITLDRVVGLTWYDDATKATAAPSDLGSAVAERP
jgi:O-antigen ligase